MTVAKEDSTSPKDLYARWIDELWAGEPIANELDMLAARWIGTGASPDGPKRFTGNDMFKVADGRFVEYWTGTSEG